MLYRAFALLLVVCQVAPSIQQDVACSEFQNEVVIIPDVATIRWTVNADTMDAAKSTIKIQYEFSALGWLSVAVAETPGMMVGAEAVIGLPDEPVGPTNPGKYMMAGKNDAGVTLMPTEQQTLMDADIIQEDGMTILTYTKFLQEANELSINANGTNSFLGAGGASNTLGYHGPNSKGGFALDMTSDCVDGVLATNAAPAPAPTTSSSPQRLIMGTTLCWSLLSSSAFYLISGY